MAMVSSRLLRRNLTPSRSSATIGARRGLDSTGRNSADRRKARLISTARKLIALSEKQKTTPKVADSQPCERRSDQARGAVLGGIQPNSVDQLIAAYELYHEGLPRRLIEGV